MSTTAVDPLQELPRLVPPPHDLLPDLKELISPALFLRLDMIKANLRAMVELARSPDRLRIHVKTHKMPDLVKLASELGVVKSKAATIAEAEMVARAGGGDVLLAYPLVGPNLPRWANLIEAFPSTTFRAVVDNLESLESLSDHLPRNGRRYPVLLDLEVGMGRTGIPTGPAADELYAAIEKTPNLVPDGIHAYDGQIHEHDVDARRRATAKTWDQVLAMRDRLAHRGLPVPRLVLGGTPTFALHAELSVEGVECSPGTCVLHDWGYFSKFPDLPFRPAALLLTRVVSRPRPGRICLDLGHKAIAADPPAGERLRLPQVPDARMVGQNEEHLIVETEMADELPPGTALFAVPSHICPTCALHQRVFVLMPDRSLRSWVVTARDRVLDY